MGLLDFAFAPKVSDLLQKRDLRGLTRTLQNLKYPAARAEAARALGTLRAESCKPDLYAGLDDADENVRVAAAEALDAIDQPTATRRPAGPRREMRIFISSTFRDMQLERDLLIRQVFPAIRQLCRSRGVGFTEVDLRWGVTEQQAERGEVLPVCLAEIQNSRPYFIGLLGERYGWVPGQIAPGLVREQPWLKEHLEASVTELEILHGVLNDPAGMARALFYFRDPAYVAGLAPAERADYVSEEPAAQDKLQRLKDRIRASGLPMVENYPNPAALAQRVQADLTAAVEHDFPAAALDPLAQERADHAAFAETRCKVYIRRAELLTRLHQQVESSAVPVVLTGDSGLGKSALLANWAADYQAAAHPDAFVLCHFIGATAQSTGYSAIQSRIMAELKGRFQIDRELPTDPQTIRRTFTEWLRLAARRGTVVLVLDGLNQLEDRDNAPDLVWLPETFPATVKVVLSTLPGRSLDVARKRGWQVVAVEGLDRAERKRMIYAYLALYRKRLSNRHVDEIAAADQTANPLFLKAVLDELRIFGIHEQLDERLRYYLQADTVGGLYQRILERLEQDYTYADGRAGLVKEALAHLWAARDGLHEDELLTLLGPGGAPLPRAVWSPLYLSLQESLVNRAGALAFFHSYLTEAVQQRYLPQPEDQRAAHHRLGAFFETHPVAERQIRELSWQWQQAEAWPELAARLAGLDFFTRLWRLSEYEVKTYWTAVEAHSALSAGDAYRPVLDAPETHTPVVREISVLLADIGHVREAVALREFLVDLYRARGEKDMLVGALNNLAVLLHQRGDLTGAILLEQEAEQLCRDGTASTVDQIVTANNKAAFAHAQGNLAGALEMWEQLARYCREQDRTAELPHILTNMALVRVAFGKWNTALENYRESEQLSRAESNSETLILALAGQANVLGNLGRHSEAFALNEQAAQLCRDLGNKRNLLSVLSSQVILCQTTGQPEKAYPLAQEEAQIARELGDQEGLANALMLLGVVEQARGNLEVAWDRFGESEKICRQIGNRETLHSALGNRATLLRQRGQLREALQLQKEVEQICRDLGNRLALQTSLGNQANILFDLNDLEGALNLNRQKVAICKEMGFIRGQALGLANEAGVMLTMGRTQEALACADEASRLAQEYQLPGIRQQMEPIYRAAGR